MSFVELLISIALAGGVLGAGIRLLRARRRGLDPRPAAAWGFAWGMVQGLLAALLVMGLLLLLGYWALMSLGRGW